MNITCLIPAFKIKYLRTLLLSLNTQQVMPSRIIISDDSPNNDFLKAFETVPKAMSERLPLELYEGPKQGHYKNIEFLLSKYQEKESSHFHILYDDDQILPEFYNEHQRAHTNLAPLCTVSRRWFMNAGGEPFKSSEIPDLAINPDHIHTKISKKNLAEHFVSTNQNWIGELSFAVFHKAFLEKGGPFHSHQGISIAGLNDISCYLKAALIGDVVFINQFLGMFRISPESHSQSMGFVYSLALLAKINFAILAHQNNLIEISLVEHALDFTLMAWERTYNSNWVSETLQNHKNILQGDGFDPFREAFLEFHKNYYQNSPELKACNTRKLLVAQLQ